MLFAACYLLFQPTMPWKLADTEIEKKRKKKKTQAADKAHSSIADSDTRYSDTFAAKASHKRISHLTYSCGLKTSFSPRSRAFAISLIGHLQFT